MFLFPSTENGNEIWETNSLKRIVTDRVEQWFVLLSFWSKSLVYNPVQNAGQPQLGHSHNHQKDINKLKQKPVDAEF